MEVWSEMRAMNGYPAWPQYAVIIPKQTRICPRGLQSAHHLPHPWRKSEQGEEGGMDKGQVLSETECVSAELFLLLLTNIHLLWKPLIPNQSLRMLESVPVMTNTIPSHLRLSSQPVRREKTKRKTPADTGRTCKLWGGYGNRCTATIRE